MGATGPSPAGGGAGLGPALARLRGLQGVDGAALAELAAAGEPRRMEGGEALLAHGDVADRAWLLVEGRLLLRWGSDGRALGDLWPGEVVGEGALFGVPRPRTGDLVCAGPALLLGFSADALRALGPRPAVAALQRRVLASTARRLQGVDLERRRAGTPPSPAAPPAEPRAAEPSLLQRLMGLLGVRE